MRYGNITNATFGLILPQGFVGANFTVTAKDIRHWGDDVIEIGEPRLVCASLDGVFFDADGAKIMKLLRGNVKDSWDSSGFLARFG